MKYLTVKIKPLASLLRINKILQRLKIKSEE